MATQYTAGLSAGDVLTAATMNSIGAAWESYTPTLTQSATVTKTVTYAKYTRINKLCMVNVRLDVTGAGTAANSVVVGLPLTSATANINIGSVSLYDASTSTNYSGTCFFATTSTITLTGDWSGPNFWGVTPNVALAANDQIHISLQYEIA
jgi:hypothetical protein